MRRVVARSVTAVLSLMIFALPVAASAEGPTGGGRSPAVVPAEQVAGTTGGALVGDWFVNNLAADGRQSIRRGGESVS
jgi:hypothetical protein